MKMKKYVLGVIFTNLSVFCIGQQNVSDSINSFGKGNQPVLTVNDSLFSKDERVFSSNLSELNFETRNQNFDFQVGDIDSKFFLTTNNNEFMKQKIKLDYNNPSTSNKNLPIQNDNFFEKNRRNIYSSMWAFASLNYLYCDIVGLMDKNMHLQYQTGVVDGTEMTPQFLTGAAIMMQIAIANVFLPQLIKNDRTLRWVQIASGITMTLIQSASLFVGKPTPYYATFSAFEIGATTFITLYSLKWKTTSKKQLPKQFL
jgi:hypothetical protein